MDSQRLAEIEARWVAANLPLIEYRRGGWQTLELSPEHAEALAHAGPDVQALLAEVRRLTAENEAMRDILRPFMPLIVPPGCNVWALVKAVVSGLRKPIPMPEEDPIRKDVWVGGRSDVVARLGDD